MIKQIDKPLNKTYYILQNGALHYGYVDENFNMSSGLTTLETFTIQDDWIARLTELGITLTITEKDIYGIPLTEEEQEQLLNGEY